MIASSSRFGLAHMQNLSSTKADFSPDLETIMRRIAISLAALLTCFVCLTAAEADPITLKFSQFLGPTSFFQVDVVEPWAKELEAKTNGQVKVEIIDGTMPLGKVTEQAGNVKDGKVDIALGLRGAEGDRFPGTSVIELPFVVPDALSGSKALWGLYKDGTIADELCQRVSVSSDTLSIEVPGRSHP